MEPNLMLIETLYAKLLHGDSTLLVGPPKSGKTSILNNMMDALIFQQISQDNPVLLNSTCLPPCYFDFQTLGNKVSSDEFWETLFNRVLSTRGLQAGIYQTTKEVIEAQVFEPYEIETYFLKLESQNTPLSLLIDHLDLVLTWPNATIQKVLGPFRIISSSTNGLRFVMASRHQLSELNKLTAILNPQGSPYFNTYFQVLINS